MNIINENISLLFLLYFFIYVFKKINSVYFMNDDDIFVFMIIFVVKLRWMIWNYVLRVF